MKLKTLKSVIGWVFILGHFSSFIILFLWALFWADHGFSEVSEIITLLLPITGVAALAAFKAFWVEAKETEEVSKDAALASILIPCVMILLIWCLIFAFVNRIGQGLQTVKIGISLCQLVFGGIIVFINEKLFSQKTANAGGRRRDPKGELGKGGG